MGPDRPGRLAAEIYAIVVWHYHGEARVYHDVVVQLADDSDFIENVQTIFNNDLIIRPAWEWGSSWSTSRTTGES